MAQMRPKPRSIRAQTAPIRTRSGSNPPSSHSVRSANAAANSNPLTTLRITPMDRLPCSHTPSVNWAIDSTYAQSTPPTPLGGYQPAGCPFIAVLSR